MNTRLRTLVAAAGVAAMSLAGLAPASAATWSYDDSIGDVESYTVDFETEEESGPDPAPENTTSDVRRMSIKHLRGRLTLNALLVDIALESGYMQYEIRAGERRYFVLQRLGRNEFGPRFLFVRGNGRRVSCDGLYRGLDRQLEFTTVSIPRRCLGKPRWVRVGGAAIGLELNDSSFTQYVDDGLRDAPIQDRLTLSPRVYHG